MGADDNPNYPPIQPQKPIATGEVTGRTQKPLSKKLNPLWWFGNEDNQNVGTMTSAVGDTAPWFHGADPTVKGWMGPTWPQWRRYLQWNFTRNPLNNFDSYVIGAQDQNYTVDVIKGDPSPTLHERDDVGEACVQIDTLNLKDGRKLPWFSYVQSAKDLNLFGKSITLPGFIFNVGWSPEGNFSIKAHPTMAKTDAK